MTRRRRRMVADLCLAVIVAGVVATGLRSDAAAGTPAVTLFSTAGCSGGGSYLVAGPGGDVWFDGDGLGRIDPWGTVTDFPGPVGHLTNGPDGNLWFTDGIGNAAHHVGSMTPSGALVSLYSIPASSTDGIAFGADGNLWVTEYYDGAVARVTPSGTVTTYPIPTASDYPWEITAGPDGNLWFLEGPDRIGEVILSGAGAPRLVDYPQGSSESSANGAYITAGPDGNVWFTNALANEIGRVAPDGTVTHFPIPTANSRPLGIVAAPDGNLWFAELAAGQLGTITPSGSITEHPLLPGEAPGYIAAGSDGNLWFSAGSSIGRYPLSGTTPTSPPPAPVTFDETGGAGSTLLTQSPTPIYCSSAVVGPGRTLDVAIPPSTSGPNDSITGVVLDVSASMSTASGFLTLYPTGQARPLVAQLRFSAGVPARGEVSVPTGPGGSVTIYNSAGNTRVDLQVIGYLMAGSNARFLPPTAGRYVPLPARRVVDTRTGSGLPDDGEHPQPGTGFPVVLNGMDGLPGDEEFTAIANVTVLNPSANGTLQLSNPISPSTTPLASIDFAAGRTAARRLLLPYGTLTATLQGAAADVTVDVDGYFTSGYAGLVEEEEGQTVHQTLSTPIEDTTSGSGLPGQGQTMGPGGVLTVQVAGRGGVPPTSSAQRPTAALLDVGISGAGGAGTLTVGASGSPVPPVPDLVWSAGDTPTNVVIVPVGDDGNVTLYNGSGNTDVRVAVAGWMSAGTDVDQPVTAPTTVGLGASTGTAAFGAAVTLTATVGSAGGTPSGSVTFFDGTSALGTSTVAGGQASFTTSTLAPGGHTLTAEYGGDGANGSSTSPAVTETVSPPPPGWTPSPSPSSSAGPTPTPTPSGGSSGPTNASYIDAAFQTMLGHGPDSGSFDYWLGVLDSGTPRSALAYALATSSEFRTDLIAGSGSGQDFYDLYLHRPYDPSGAAYWVGRMAQGLTFEQVRLAFIGSPEYFAVHNDDPSQTIDALYQDVLGRSDATDPAGKDYWMTHFDVNTIASQFLYSYEGRAHLVETYYAGILHRTADAAGLDYWTQAILGGASDENVIAFILGSNEYFQSH